MNDDKKITGRSSSQISIYDYPEHLNPFYEDDNHKRIRFWKIGSKNHKTSRSNSFSFNGLKEMWAFKSFKLKKRSSTLGINKTSESPPMLRRQVHPVNDTYNTVDSRLRHTVDVGLGSNFHRGAGYRSSLQDVNTIREDNEFYRNNRYRSTMQNGYQTLATPPQGNRYFYNGSITPTPRAKYGVTNMTHGSSQSSLNSTNPFEEDDSVSQVGSVDGISIRKSGKKKRRAPPPPSPLKSSADLHRQAITTVEENSREGSGNEELTEISTLTAQIECFVKTADNDKEDLHVSSSKSEPIVVNLEKIEISHGQDLSKKEFISYVKVDTPSVIPINTRESPENNEEYPEQISQFSEIDSHNQLTKYQSEKQLNTATHLTKAAISSQQITEATIVDDSSDNEQITNIYIDEHQSLNTPLSTEFEFILEQPDIKRNTEFLPQQTIDDLKITESTDDLTNSSTTSIESDKYRIRYVPLKNFSPVPLRRDIDSKNHEQNGAFSEEIKLQPPPPPERRRSVKDIIASINKSQSLLKINQDANVNKFSSLDSIRQVPNTITADPTRSIKVNENIITNISGTRTVEQNNKKEFGKNEFEQFDDGDTSNIPIIVERFDEYNNNNNSDQLFKKCVVRPDQNSNRPSLEWNPVPKPRRSRNLSMDNDSGKI